MGNSSPAASPRRLRRKRRARGCWSGPSNGRGAIWGLPRSSTRRSFSWCWRAWSGRRRSAMPGELVLRSWHRNTFIHALGRCRAKLYRDHLTTCRFEPEPCHFRGFGGLTVDLWCSCGRRPAVLERRGCRSLSVVTGAATSWSTWGPRVRRQTKWP